MFGTDNGYGRVARLLHWSTVLLVLVLLGSGFRAAWSEDAAVKAAALRVHLPVVITVLVLTLGRMLWWWRWDRRPAPVAGVPRWQEAAARAAHPGLYAVLLALLGSGVALSVLSGLALRRRADA